MRTLFILAAFVVNDVLSQAQAPPFDDSHVKNAETYNDLMYNPAKDIPLQDTNYRDIAGLKYPEIITLNGNDEHHIFVGDKHNAAVLQVAQKKR
ncbi:unnamed protein product [Caenorhabditis angaria]|uniref:Uncharacterized protein n=1 Tax=Caenorhabditis angaria TaxID=860376 RepID=A0A9P1IF25_9PELO|nr:unnamed protein product [Caenorhabditis angaria]